jgi:carbon monoxide dehydrogenase subunit G
MPQTASFVVSSTPDRVAEYLSDPRNALIANHDGPVVERSVPPIERGSWAVLAFDQLRVRVEYLAVEPDQIAVVATYSGPGSGGMTASATYGLVVDGTTGGTRVNLDVDGTGRFVARAMSRLTWPLVWRRLRNRMERGTA